MPPVNVHSGSDLGQWPEVPDLEGGTSQLLGCRHCSAYLLLGEQEEALSWRN